MTNVLLMLAREHANPQINFVEESTLKRRTDIAHVRRRTRLKQKLMYNPTPNLDSDNLLIKKTPSRTTIISLHRQKEYVDLV